MSEYYEEYETEDCTEDAEDIVYMHDIQSEANRAKRKANAVHKEKDREKGAKHRLTDTALAKKMLHKSNRRSKDVTSYTYYRNKYGIESVEYGLA